MEPEANFYPVVAFDLDGTLLRRTTVLRLLAEYLGQAEAIAELDRAFTAGEIPNRVIADESAAWFDGCTTRQLRAVLAAGSWIRGIDETLQTLAGAGVQVLLATITWRFAA